MNAQTIASPIPAGSTPRPSIERTLVAALTLTALADWLFFDSTPGISIVVFLAALAAAVVITERARPSWRQMAGGLTILELGLLPLIEDISLLSLLFGVLGLSGFALTVAGGLSPGWRGRLADIGTIMRAPFRLLPDLAGAITGLSRLDVAKAPSGLAMWVVPVGLGAVFLALFSSANPLIEAWLSAIRLLEVWAKVSVVRLLFWLAFASLAWGFVTLRHGRRPAPPEIPAGPERPAVGAAEPASLVFGYGAILRSLVVFNVLFALQSGLDIAFLWRGVSLPGGATFADYAHRGAYPLMVTALLAAAFVIAAMRPGTAAERSALVRGLVFLWTAQNILLVASAMLRLDLYVATYSLTTWRMAAFVWMGLVVVGLVLIIVRIALGLPNSWLVSANMAAALATLYACSFVNFAHLIATYNVAHSREMTGQGTGLDERYLESLGPQAIPAMDLFIERYIEAKSGAQRQYATQADRRHLAAQLTWRAKDWRAWTFRDVRLARYLEPHAAAP